MIWAIFAVGVTLYFLFAYLTRPSTANLPPGPSPWPFIGNAHMVDFSRVYVTLDEWKQKYGDIVSARFINQQVIVLNSYETLKEAFVTQGDNFAARPALFIFADLSGGTHAGVAQTMGPLWKEQRRFTMHVLKNFGMGRSIMEDKVTFEVEQVCDIFDKCPKESGTQGIDVVLPLKVAVANIITNVLMDYRFQFGSEEFNDIQRRVGENFDNINKQLPLEFFPFLRRFPFLFNRQQTKDNVNFVLELFNKRIQQHVETFNEDLAPGEPSDYIYAYLAEMKKQGSRIDTTFTNHQLLWNILDLFVAGFETTATTLSWYFVFMVHHPDVLQKMKAEITREVRGSPMWADRQRLHYCNAVIAEIQRCGNIAPTGLFHSCHEDAKIKGYAIPKGSLVIPNIYSIMRDEHLFTDATEFNPDRFIDEDGCFIDKVDGLIPFSVGKRQCLGEGLARMELFMFVTKFSLRYRIEEGPGGKPSLEPNSGLTLYPKPFQVSLISA